MEENYWTKRRRYTRRGFIRGMGLAAGVVTLAPVIAACGSNSNNSSNTKSTTTTTNKAATSAPASTKAATSAPTTAAATTAPSSAASSAAAYGTSVPASARKASAPGITTDTILLGTTAPLSGPASSYAPIVQTQLAYLQKINEQGGVNGRQVKLMVEDDQYDPSKTLPLIKKLVEQEHVFCTAFTLGTPTNTTIVEYLNENKIPMLFIESGGNAWGDYQKYPWSIGFQTSYGVEGKAYGKYITTNWPGKKVGLLYQNDDFGKGYLTIKQALGKSNPVVDEETYEPTDSDVSTQITNLKNKGAEVFVLIAIPKQAGLALKSAAAQGWKPNIILSSVSADPTIFGLAGGNQNMEGVISDGYQKQYDSGDPSIQPVKDLLAKYAPQTQLANFPVFGYMTGQILVETLKRAGVNPTRESMMKAVESFQNYKIDQLIDGITVSTSHTDHYPIKQVQFSKATNGKFIYFGPIVSGA